MDVTFLIYFNIAITIIILVTVLLEIINIIMLYKIFSVNYYNAKVIVGYFIVKL